MKMTKATKASDIKRSWYLIDLNKKILGRISSEIAKLLMGKSKPYYVRNLDCGDYVVVINAKNVKVTGKKEENKKYYRHSGYPGGLRVRTFKELKQSKPEEIIRHAVKGMLPQNKLRDRMLTRLFVYRDENHPYGDKIK
ncbi:MAG: 50S ribosomal protein L13 [Candidatus Levybacteria bacterium RIFCSPLOWO2_01_FULL_38_21]|nr:MAG: 50S ribosomal protein L13 [Candidatus Levybacteria bacterium RIFCSPLOWO2_01_FULL_38_21]